MKRVRKFPKDYSIFPNLHYTTISVEQELKKWCIEQAGLLTGKNDPNGITIIKTAQKIYDWVTK